MANLNKLFNVTDFEEVTWLYTVYAFDTSEDPYVKAVFTTERDARSFCESVAGETYYKVTNSEDGLVGIWAYHNKKWRRL